MLLGMWVSASVSPWEGFVCQPLESGQSLTAQASVGFWSKNSVSSFCLKSTESLPCGSPGMCSQGLLVSLASGKTKISCSVGGVGMFSCCFARKNFNPDWMKLAILSEGLSTNKCLLAKINCTDQKSSCGCSSLLQCFLGALGLKNKVNFLIFMPL